MQAVQDVPKNWVEGNTSGCIISCGHVGRHRLIHVIVYISQHQHVLITTVRPGNPCCLVPTGGDGTPTEHSQSPRHPEGWCPSDMHDFGTAFDSLNLSTVPSDVRIEHLPQDGQHIEEMLRHAVQENGFPDVPPVMTSSAGEAALRSLHSPRAACPEREPT